MPQPAAPPFQDGLTRPLPQGIYFRRSPAPGQRFLPIDILWIGCIIAATELSCVVIAQSGLAAPAILAMNPAIVTLTYFLALRLSNRSAAVISALLLATSAAFVNAPISLSVQIFVALTVGALLAFASGSSLVALVIAGIAAWFQASGIALGALLAFTALVQRRRRAKYATALFGVLVVAAVIVHALTEHSVLPAAVAAHKVALFYWLISPEALLTVWFILPFLGELAEHPRRAHWTGLLLWAAAIVAAGAAFSLTQHKAIDTHLYAFLPLWYIVIGAGIARLLPSITGEIPVPMLRYAIAIVAVALLIGIRARLAWPISHRSAPPVPIVIPAPKATAVPAPKTTRPVVLPATTPLTQVHKPSVASHPKPIAIIAKPPVPVRKSMTGHRAYRYRRASRWRRYYRRR